MGRLKVTAGGALAIGVLAAAGCSTTSGEGGLASLGDMILYAGTTVPPPAREAVEDVYCPYVRVIDGGSVLQSQRSQTSLGQLARECVGRDDGSTLVKIGAEGRLLLTSGSAAGRYEVPVRFVVKRGDAVIASRVRRAVVVVPAGDSQGSFAVVEEGIAVPASAAQDFDIEVGLGGEAPRRRRG